MIDKYNYMLVFDFETTGLMANKCQIIEIGAILYKKTNTGWDISEVLSLLVKTNKSLPKEIVEITNITDEMLKEKGVTEEEAFYRLDKLIDDNTLLVAYNIQFDYSFLVALYAKYTRREIANDILDVMALYKDRHMYPHRLSSAVSKYDINLQNAHRALDDARATAAVLAAMMKEKNNAYKYVNVLGFNPRYGVAGYKIPYVKYIAQYGGKEEIEKKYDAL